MFRRLPGIIFPWGLRIPHCSCWLWMIGSRDLEKLWEAVCFKARELMCQAVHFATDLHHSSLYSDQCRFILLAHNKVYLLSLSLFCWFRIGNKQIRGIMLFYTNKQMWICTLNTLQFNIMWDYSSNRKEAQHGNKHAFGANNNILNL